MDANLRPESPAKFRNKKILPKDGPLKLPKKQICINLTNCSYDVIRHTCEKILGWKVFQNDAENTNCDIIWNDSNSNENLLAQLKPYQKLNHFPGICTIGRKNFLAMHFNKMQKAFPSYYDFFPKTYCLPTEKNLVRQIFESKKPNQVFIVKPDSSSEGRGIFLTKKIEDIPFTDNFIVQKYVKNPYLIDGLKFDLRIYVLITSVDPLTIYIYDNGIARFATDEYTQPGNGNLANLFQHLTNYAINKNSKNFKFDADPNRAEIGHKRSLQSVWNHFEKQNIDQKSIWNNIKRSVVKTICGIQPILKQIYKSSQPDDFTGGMCFQLLGLDVLLTRRLKVKILEVNHAPSFNSDTPYDFKLKSELFRNMFELLQCNLETRFAVIEKSKQIFEDKFKNGVRNKCSQEEKERIKETYLQEHEKKISGNFGGFERIYPIANPLEPYEEFMKFAEERETHKLGVDNKKPKRIVENTKSKVRSTSSIAKGIGRDKENEINNKIALRLNQKVKLEQIQETVNRLYSRKTIEIKEAQELIAVRQNLELQKYYDRVEKFKTSVINLEFGF